MEGVILGVVLAGIVVVTWKRQNTGARIGAILAVIIAFWFAIALVSPGQAGTMAAWVAEGFEQIITGTVKFLGQL